MKAGPQSKIDTVCDLSSPAFSLPQPIAFYDAPPQILSRLNQFFFLSFSCDKVHFPLTRQGQVFHKALLSAVHGTVGV